MAKIAEDPKIWLLARELGIKKKSNPDETIREYCFLKVENILQDFIVQGRGSVNSLDKLLELTAAKLDLKFEEVLFDEDLQGIKTRYVSNGELAFLDFIDDFDDDTDAVLVQLRNTQRWEPKFVAIIDCRGLKSLRAYFSKWHEIAHLLTTPPQMHLPFRRTHAVKKDPEEILMDKIAGDLGFYSPLFLPEVRARTDKNKKLTFKVINELRYEVCSSASPQATIRAAVDRVSFPGLFLIAEYALKKEEERLVNSGQYLVFPQEKKMLEKKFRATKVQSNNPARQSALLIFKNMEVPDESIIKRVLDNPEPGQVFSNVENLNWWKSSKGRLGDYDVYVEAKKIGDTVWALVSAK